MPLILLLLSLSSWAHPHEELANEVREGQEEITSLKETYSEIYDDLFREYKQAPSAETENKLKLFSVMLLESVEGQEVLYQKWQKDLREKEVEGAAKRTWLVGLKLAFYSLIFSQVSEQSKLHEKVATRFFDLFTESYDRYSINGATGGKNPRLALHVEQAYMKIISLIWLNMKKNHSRAPLLKEIEHKIKAHVLDPKKNNNFLVAEARVLASVQIGDLYVYDIGRNAERPLTQEQITRTLMQAQDRHSFDSLELRACLEAHELVQKNTPVLERLKRAGK